MFRKLFSPREKAAADRFSVAPGDRIYAVGDIHGRADLLKKMLVRISEDQAALSDDRQTRLVLLGDYIDRGDDTAQVLEILLQSPDIVRDRTTMLLGNHEAAMLSFLDDPVGAPHWLEYGAIQTLASFGVSPPGEQPDPGDYLKVRDDLLEAVSPYLDLISAMVPSYQSGDVIFAHAGWREPSAGMETNANDIIWGYPEFLCDQPVSGRMVVHGHYDAAEPVKRTGRICVDTGAYYTGTLTAVRMDETETFIYVN